MAHSTGCTDRGVVPGPVVSGVSAGELDQLVRRLAELPVAADDAGRVEQLRLLEELKAASAAAQARVTVAFEDSQRRAQVEAGAPPERVGRGIGTQVALARRDAPHRGGHHVGMARALVKEMPHTYQALAGGVLTEFRAMLLVRETAQLTGSIAALWTGRCVPTRPGWPGGGHVGW